MNNDYELRDEADLEGLFLKTQIKLNLDPLFDISKELTSKHENKTDHDETLKIFVDLIGDFPAS